MVNEVVYVITLLACMCVAAGGFGIGYFVGRVRHRMKLRDARMRLDGIRRREDSPETFFHALDFLNCYVSAVAGTGKSIVREFKEWQRLSRWKMAGHSISR